MCRKSNFGCCKDPAVEVKPASGWPVKRPVDEGKWNKLYSQDIGYRMKKEAVLVRESLSIIWLRKSLSIR